MTHIWPIVVKNFIYVKRNIFKTIFQVLYPCLYVVFIGLIFNTMKSEKDSKVNKETFYDKLDIYEFPNKAQFNPPFDKRFGLIGETSLRSNFINYLNELGLTGKYFIFRF